MTSSGGKLSPRAAHPHARGNGVAGAESCPDAGLAPAQDNLSRTSAAILCLLNGERASAGLAPLAANDQLAHAAQGMSDEIVAEHFFSHVTPGGRDLVARVRPTGYLPRSGEWVIGENLGWGSGSFATPEAMLTGWMNSPGHRANILAPDYRDIGIGIALGSPTPGDSSGVTYTTDFGRRPPQTTGSGALAIAVPARVGARLAAAVARGLAYRVHCSRRCSLVARLYVDARAAQTARLASTRVAIATTRARLRSAGTTRVELHLGARAKQALRRLKRIRLALVTTAPGTRAARTTSVSLR